MNAWLDRLASVRQRYDELNHLLEETGDDYQRASELARERAELEPIAANADEYERLSQQTEEARSLLNSSDEELRELAQADLETLEPRLEQAERDLKAMLLPKDPRDERNVIVEIRAGAGGDEAGLFAADLMRMYLRYAERKGWKVEILSQNETGIGGVKEVDMEIKGKGAYSRLKYESGVHRVQRIPVTESSGRIHTSTATVAVLPEADEVDVQIPETDLHIDVFRSSGAGGQNVQKNATAVRITHIPTGIVVACQDERSQLQNRLRAMSILRAKLYQMQQEKLQAEIDQTRRSQVGSGERSEKIRTYNFPQSRITDHRINFSTYDLDAVLDGDLDVFIDQLVVRDEAERLAALGEQAAA
jgi:peptide chain release factor 1